MRVASLVFAGMLAGDQGTTTPDAPVDAAYDAPPVEPLQIATITATVASTRFVTREHFLASAKTQITGRDHLSPNLYFDPASDGDSPWIDLPGLSAARARVSRSRERAIDAVRAAASVRRQPALVRAAGLPDVGESRRLIDALTRTVWSSHAMG